jgi:hypothetical protein
MTLRTALASLAVVTWVLVIGSLADMHDLRSWTTFALGVVAAIPGLLAGGWADEGGRRG